MSTTSVQGIWASSIILPVLDITVVALRFYARSSRSVNLKLDDYLQIPGLILFIGIAITAMIGAANHAFGYPTPIVESPVMVPESLILAEKLWFVIQVVQIPCLAITKIAALMFYKRIFVTQQGPLLWIIRLLSVATIIWGLGFLGFYLGVCKSHLSAAWSGWLGFAEYCINTEYFEQGYAISDFLLDTFILLVPLPSIAQLHTTIGRKLGITAVFLFALIGYGASIARMVLFIELSNSSLANQHALPDIQSTDTQAVWLTNLEVGLAIFALNLPSIWGLLSKVTITSLINSIRGRVSLQSSRNTSNPRSSEWYKHKKLQDSAHSTELSNKILSSRMKPSYTEIGQEQHSRTDLESNLTAQRGDNIRLETTIEQVHSYKSS